MKDYIANRIYLFKNGNTCDSNSGGWIVENAWINDNYIYMPFSNNPSVSTNNEIKIGTLYVDIERTSQFDGEYAFKIYMNDRYIYEKYLEKGRQVLKIDVNNIGILKIVSYFFDVKIYNIWIEK